MTSPSPLSFLTDETKQDIKQIVCTILEIEEDELTETSSFRDDHHMDSLTAIEIVAAMEKRLKVTIEEEDMKQIVNLAGVYEVVEARAAGN